MGPVWTWESLESTTYTMRAVVLVLLGLVAINAEAEANHHVYNSVVHHGYGHVAGVHPVHHGYGHVAGVHPVHNHHAVPAVHHYNHFMYGKREAEAEADPQLVHHTRVGHGAHVPTVHHVAGGYAHPYHYNHFMYGKREAEAEPEADPVLIHHGVGQVIHPGHPVHTVHAGVNHVAGVYTHPFHYNYMYGKREAEAEAEADPVMVHHTGVHHPVHASVYNHHMVPAVHTGVHHVGAGHVAGVHPVHAVRGIYNGIYNTYPRTYWG